VGTVRAHALVDASLDTDLIDVDTATRPRALVDAGWPAAALRPARLAVLSVAASS
jgi:hypothetical protein